MDTLEEDDENLFDVLLSASLSEVCSHRERIEWLCAEVGCTSEAAAKALAESGGDLMGAMLSIKPQSQHKASVARVADHVTPGHMTPYQFTLLSWNVDGFNDWGITERFSAVIATIKDLKADIVFLQEVTHNQSDRIKGSFGKSYEIVWGKKELEYFNVILIKRKSEFELEDTEVVAFPNSVMGRHVVRVQCKRGGRSFQFMTSHIESLKCHKEERQSQMKSIFNEMQFQYGPNDIVIFGGDTNLRKIDNVLPPNDVKDCWVECGSEDDVKHTWDTSVNHNLGVPFAARLRFDRVYYRETKLFDVESFKLVGKEKLLSCDAYPSDHWGIIVTFSVN